jgi:hypothetical protein
MYKKSMSSYNHFLASIIFEFQSNQFVNICSIVLKMKHNATHMPSGRLREISYQVTQKLKWATPPAHRRLISARC